MSSSFIPHILFSASAGSGQTYQLVRRYVQLLMLGQAPESISAMTFTRKAAGEFFNRILRTLAELSPLEEARARSFLSGLEPLPETLPERTALLRELSRRIHRLRLGTMDSFFAQVTTCFPLELGLPLGARVMAEDEAKQSAVDALEALLDRIYLESEDGAARTVLEAFKQGTFGAEEKSAQASLLDWIESGHEVWLDSGGKGWGDLNALRTGAAAALGEARPVPEILADLRKHFPKTTAKGDTMLEELEVEAAAFEPGVSPSGRVKFFFDKCQDAWDALLQGEAEIAWGKKVTLEKQAASAAVELVQALLGKDLAVRAERTRGRAQVLATYEQEYARRVRGSGRLSFGDVQRLLADQTGSTRDWMTGENADLWYRMDGRFDHWLLDEFQDTSAIQWRVLRGLVDEVMQDDSDRRSFFAVGDPKQSIYLWREAMPGLFEEVLHDYPYQEEDGQGLRQKGLSQSWRSAKPVLDAVNQVFGDAEALEALLPGSLEGWSFEPHVPAKPELEGACMLLSPGPGEGDSTEQVIASLLAELNPVDRSLSCAILVRSNKEARGLTEVLRGDPRLSAMEVVCESDQNPATDNAATLALLSLLQWSAHPDDTMAREHLRMTPLWPAIELEGRGPEITAARVRRAIDGGGFTGWLQEWLPKMEAHVELDAFHRHRLDQFAEIVAEFDAGGSRDVDAFVRFARDKPVRERGASGAIQVMTIHASKGLEFDVVIVTQLGGNGMNVTRPDELLKHRSHGRVEWVLEAPTKTMAQFNDVLRHELEEQSRLQGFESLCRMYVAMTRAKHGLYLVADTAPKGGTAVNAARLLRERLGQEDETLELAGHEVRLEWETGNRDWYASKRSPSKTGKSSTGSETDAPPLGELLQSLQPIARRRTPSGEEAFRVTGAQLFGEGREPGRKLGSLVHLLLSRLQWRDDSLDLETLRDQWTQAGDLTLDDPVSSEAMQHVERALKTSLFDVPDGSTLIWRERSFDLIIKGEWISGIFDRVELRLSKAGTPVSARIIDFKTDDAPTEEAFLDKVDGYRPQLRLYREAVSRLTGLPEQEIELCLLFTRTGRVEKVLA